MSGGGVSSGNYQEIVQKLVALLREDKVDEAARVYSRLTEDIGYYLVQKMARMASIGKRLAKMFYVAKDFEKAALVFEEVQEYDKAARLYAKGDNYGMAAEMFAKVGDNDNAAQMYEKHGSYATAAELYQEAGNLGRAAANFEKAVNHFKAGKTYFELGKFDKAMELLQKVTARDFNYIESALMLNEILARQGYRSIAIMKLAAILEERGLETETLDVALALAENAVEERDYELARRWLKRILEIKFPYKNARDMLSWIEAGNLPAAQKVDLKAAESAAQKIAAGGLPPKAAAPPVARPTVTVAGEPTNRNNVSQPSGSVESLEYEEVYELEPVEDAAPVMQLEAEFETIRNAPLFQELSLQELKKFWMLVMPLDFAPGEIIIEQDQPGSGLYILSKGKVKVTKVEGASEQTLAELGAGAHLGEMSLLDDTPTSARVTAVEPVDAYLMPKDAFQNLIGSDDRLARKIYQAFAATLMGRLRDTNAQFKSFKSKQQTEMADLFGLKDKDA